MLGALDSTGEGWFIDTIVVSPLSPYSSLPRSDPFDIMPERFCVPRRFRVSGDTGPRERMYVRVAVGLCPWCVPRLVPFPCNFRTSHSLARWADPEALKFACQDQTLIPVCCSLLDCDPASSSMTTRVVRCHSRGVGGVATDRVGEPSTWPSSNGNPRCRLSVRHPSPVTGHHSINFPCAFEFYRLHSLDSHVSS